MPTIRELFPFGDLDDDVAAIAAARFPGLPQADIGAGFALGKAIVVAMEHIAGVLDEFELTPARWRLLMALVIQATPEGATIGELAGHLQIKEPTVTATVDRLEQEGLVARTRSTEDRRVVRVRITDHGATTVTTLLPKVAARLSGFVAALGGSSEVRQIAARLTIAAEHQTSES